jgi:uncharacterized membrane protein
MSREKLYGLWIIAFLTGLPLALNFVPRNGGIGFRTAKTLSSPVVWREANVFLGWALIAASLIGVGITYFKPEVAKKHGTLLLVSLLGVALIISYIYVDLLPG